MAGVTVIAATRETESAFVANTALGQSLAAYAPYGIDTRIFYANSRGLPECYNRALDEVAEEDEILVFLHDDVGLPDFFWLRRISAGLKLFNLIGVAGNRRRVPRQPAWAFTRIHPTEGSFEWDEQRYLSGIVGHGAGFPCAVTMYGPDEQACLLLDGVLLAARKRTFTQHGIRFDERFRFHFYDMDLCRQFERAGLTMGTCGVSVIHNSRNDNFGTAEWTAGYASYLQKWGE